MATVAVEDEIRLAELLGTWRGRGGIRRTEPIEAGAVNAYSQDTSADKAEKTSSRRQGDFTAGPSFKS